MDDFRLINAIAPAAQPPEPEPTRKTIELSEQTPLSGFDRKQKQVEAGEISDVGASIARVGQGRQSDAALKCHDALSDARSAAVNRPDAP